jgi:hypothetical protein
MTLLIHIIASCIGIVGSYASSLSTVIQYKKFNTINLNAKLIDIGTWMTLTGLAGVVVSGAYLFLNDPQKFIDSGRFLSNMTIMLLLVVIEILFIKMLFKEYPNTTHLLRNRLISSYSWSWIFIAALLNPPFSYYIFMLCYLALGGLLLYYSEKILR